MSTVNLLPRDYLQRRCQRRPNVIYMALFGVVMASIGGAALVSERNSRNTREVCQRINSAYADAAKLIDEVHQLESQKKMMLDKAKLSAALMERLPRSYVLAMVTNALPDRASVTNITLTVRALKENEGGKVEEKTKAAAVAKSRNLTTAAPAKLALTVNVKGKAATDVQVGRFITSLNRHPLTDTVELSYTKQSPDKAQASREFQLTVQLKPNADALDAIKTEPEEASRPGRDGEDGHRASLPAGKPANLGATTKPVPVSAAGGGA
jgi:Tfp pilus assembly protein PilN